MDNNSWNNYIAAPIETYHAEAVEEFHKGAEYPANEVTVEGVRYVNGIEFNRLLARFKVKIMKTYRITSDAIPCSSKITSKEDRKIIREAFYDLMSKPTMGLDLSSPETYKKLKGEIQALEKENAELRKCVEFYGEELWEDIDSDKSGDGIGCGCHPPCRCEHLVGARARKLLTELNK